MKDLDLTQLQSNYDGPINVSKEAKGPTIHLCSKKPIELPLKGSGTLTFKVRRKSHDVARGEWEVCLELVKLSGIKGKETAIAPPKEVSTGDALDALLKEAEDNESEDEYEED